MASAAAAEAPREGPPTLSVEEEEWADPVCGGAAGGEEWRGRSADTRWLATQDVEQRVVHIASQFGIRPVSEPHLLWIAAEVRVVAPWAARELPATAAR